MVKKALAFLQPAVIDGTDILLFNRIINGVLSALLLLTG